MQYVYAFLPSDWKELYMVRGMDCMAGLASPELGKLTVENGQNGGISSQLTLCIGNATLPSETLACQSVTV